MASRSRGRKAVDRDQNAWEGTPAGGQLSLSQVRVPQDVRAAGLTTKALIARSPSLHDGRRFDVKLTAAGRRAIRLVEPIIADNRRQALRGMTDKTVRHTGDALQAIVNNCQTEDDA